MASRTGSLPRNEKLTLDTPPLTFAPGKLCLIQRVAQALGHRHGLLGRAAPSEFLAVVFGRAFGGFGHFNQAFAWREVRFAFFVFRDTVQHHVFHALAQRRLKVVIHAHHARVDDAHVHAGLDGVVQEHGVDGFAHRVVAPE